MTGATGFVMSNLARHLAEAGHDVVSLDRHPPDAPIREFLSGLPGAVTFHALDVTDRDEVRRIESSTARRSRRSRRTSSARGSSRPPM